MREKKTKGQLKKTEAIPISCPPTHTLIWIKHPHLPHPMIHNNNTMDIDILIQMTPSNKCGSARNDEIFNLHLGSGAGPRVTIPCLLQDIRQIYRFHPCKQLTRKKQRTQKWDWYPNKSYCSDFWPTDTEPRANR